MQKYFIIKLYFSIVLFQFQVGTSIIVIIIASVLSTCLILQQQQMITIILQIIHNYPYKFVVCMCVCSSTILVSCAGKPQFACISPVSWLIARQENIWKIKLHSLQTTTKDYFPATVSMHIHVYTISLYSNICSPRPSVSPLPRSLASISGQTDGPASERYWRFHQR